MSGVKPFDFDGDGHPELVIGAPFKSLKGHRDQGTFVVIPGKTLGHGNAGAREWSLDSSGISDRVSVVPHSFGYAQASGDFNGDGYADLAVSAPDSTRAHHSYAGVVYVIFGSRHGLSKLGVRPLQATTPTTHGGFGGAIAAADFNGDGYADLAVGAPGVPEQDVTTWLGGATPFADRSERRLTKGNGDIHGDRSSHYGGFGTALATGDFDGDGRQDLAISDPYDAYDTGYSTGSVSTVFGEPTRTGISQGSSRLSLDLHGVPGASTTFGAHDSSDVFGIALAAGDTDGDGYDDLIVGAPGHNTSAKLVDTGLVLVARGGSGPFASGRMRVWTSSTVIGNQRASQGFGSTVAFGQVLGKGLPQIWVAAQFRNLVLQLAPRAAHPVVLSQNRAGIPDVTETNDNWGGALRPIDPDGDGVSSLAVGALGEDSFAGSVTLVFAKLTQPGRPLAGLLLKQGTGGVPGSSRAGSMFGSMF